MRSGGFNWMLQLRQVLRRIDVVHRAAMPDKAPHRAELVAVFNGPALQEHVFLVERVVIALMQVGCRRLYRRQFAQLEGSHAGERHLRAVCGWDWNADFVVVILPVKLLLVKDVEPGSTGGLDRTALDGRGDGL